MPATSEARIAANRQNAQRSTGPKTTEGKERSRRNGLKHGLSGRGVVLPEGEGSEVEVRRAALLDELDPASTLGVILVGQIATLSCRMERAARREEVATADRVRHSGETFDRARLDRAEALFRGMASAEDPRDIHRELRETPEGVNRLLRAWGDLRADLTRPSSPFWNRPNLVKAANLTGFRLVEVEESRVGALSKLAWGGGDGSLDEEMASLGPPARRRRAAELLVQWVDEEMADLQAHFETLDLEGVALDRASAADLALFEPSKDALLALRYESEARRGFFKALKELRQVEAEAETEEISEVDLSRPEDRPEEIPSKAPLGSCREPATTEPRVAHSVPIEAMTGRVRPILEGEGVARGLDGRVLAVGRAGFGVG